MAKPRHALRHAGRRPDSRPSTDPRDARPSAGRLAALLIMVAVGGGCALVAAAVRPRWQLRYTDPRQSVPEVTAVSTWRPTVFATGLPTGQVEGGGHLFDDPVRAGSGWPLIAIVGLLVAAAAVVLLIRRRCRHEVPPIAETDGGADALAPDVPVLLRGADEASRRLLVDGPPTDVVIAAWLALEEAAERAGVPRSPAESPTEFTVAVLNRTGIGEVPVRRLLRLYHRARFSAAGAGPADLAEARRCVVELADAWRGLGLATAGSR